jgi:hypothetical protein
MHRPIFVNTNNLSDDAIHPGAPSERFLCPFQNLTHHFLGIGFAQLSSIGPQFFILHSTLATGKPLQSRRVGGCD